MIPGDKMVFLEKWTRAKNGAYSLTNDIYLALGPQSSLRKFYDDSTLTYNIMYKGIDVGLIFIFKIEDDYVIHIKELDLAQHNLDKQGLGRKIIYFIESLSNNLDLNIPGDEDENDDAWANVYSVYITTKPATKDSNNFFEHLGYEKVDDDYDFLLDEIEKEIGEDTENCLMKQLV